MICADGGGSNGSRVRLWKSELARLADEQNIEVTVCHLPPATSKWNKIEHRLFSHISMNWRGRPLTSHEVIVDHIGSTRTRTGLQVHAELDAGFYATWHQDLRQTVLGAEAAANSTAQLPWRLELHRDSRHPITHW